MNGYYYPNGIVIPSNGPIVQDNGVLPEPVPTGNPQAYSGSSSSLLAPANVYNTNSLSSSLGTSLGNAWDSTNGFVNNTLGGWGNVFQGIQALGNLYGGFKQLGMMQDQLDLARDSFNFNKAITTQNLANQVKSYNTSLADRYRARAFTETGNANAYDKQIEERKLNSKI